MVATCKVGTGGGAKEKAAYYGQATLPESTAARAAYYLRGVSRGDVLHTAAVPVPDMAPEVAWALGIDPTREGTQAQVAALIMGNRADGKPLPGDQRRAEYKGDRAPVTYFDVTLSAPRSVSIAFALTEDEAERAIILQAHEEANAAAMSHWESRMAWMRRGHAGAGGRERGKTGGYRFLHVSARPTTYVPHLDADGRPDTIPMTVPGSDAVPGAMALHTHNIVPNAVVLPDGTVGKMDTLALHDGFVHEVGAVYHFTLATRLRAAGARVEIDPATELSHLPDVPRSFVEWTAKRSKKGEEAAREYAASKGAVWDDLSASAKKALLQEGIQGKGQKRRKLGEAWAEDAWRGWAASQGYEYKPVIDPVRRGVQPLPPEERHRVAYEAALPMLEKQFAGRAVLSASAARITAGRGLIASGAEGVEDMDAVVRLMREHGVRHEGQRTELVVAELAPTKDGTLAERRGAVKLTTRAHLDAETEALSLIADAAGDRSGALRPEQVDAAVERVAERDGITFEGEHGEKQRRVIDGIASGGRFVAVVGVGGAGKTTLLAVPVEAWHADGRTVFGAANAWKQAKKLNEAGIPDERTMALDKLLHMGGDGRIALGPDSVVVVDELSQVGTPQLRALARLRAERGLTVVAVGDDAQGQPVVHGNPYALIRRGLGREALPEIDSSIRQRRERDRETAALFRAGRGGEGVARLREDGRAHLVAGGYEDAVKATAALWERLTAENAHRPDYKVSVSVQTNQEARDIAAAIRDARRRRETPDLGPDAVVVAAQDQGRDGKEQTYDLPLAVGDRVRLFDRVHARIEGTRGAPIFALNGSVVRIEAFAPDGSGFVGVNAGGHRGAVAWDALRDKHTGRIRLTYGDALTVDAIQSDTHAASIAAYPAGTAGAHSKKAYVGNSRAREETHVVVSDGVERSAIAERRPIGDSRPVSAEDVWASVAANFSRDVRKELALELLDRAHRFRVGTARDFAPSMRATEERERAERTTETQPPQAPRHRDAEAATDVADTLKAAAKARTEAVKRLTWARGAAEREAQAERRSTRPASQRPKQTAGEAKRGRDRTQTTRPAPSRPVRQESRPVPEWQARADFAAAVERAGLRPDKGKGIQMDGRGHYTPVEGSKDAKSKRGFYVAHLDGWPAGTIINHRSGVRIDWRAPADGREMTEAERAAESARMAASRAQEAARAAAREREKSARRDKVAEVATALWTGAAATRGHAYLDRKGLAGIGLRVGRRGQTVEIEVKDGAARRKSVAGHLMIPMQDETGRIWGVQTIAPDGTKMFTGGMAGGRKQGTFSVIGEMRPGETVAIVEGYATGESWHRATGLTTVVAWDSGNLRPVAEAIRAMDPSRPIVFAADNDHHLPLKAIPKDNEGRVKAEAAAAAVEGVVVTPPALPERFGSAETGTDWDDFRQRYGWEATRELAGERLREHGIAMKAAVPVPAAAPQETTRGAGQAPQQHQERTMSDTERGQGQRPATPQSSADKRRDTPAATPDGAQPPRRRVERPAADAGTAAREASRRAQEQARASSSSRGHSR